MSDHTRCAGEPAMRGFKRAAMATDPGGCGRAARPIPRFLIVADHTNCIRAPRPHVSDAGFTGAGVVTTRWR